jgi:enamine deaminase RidA (YjgF/YER057c/UK114 family)
MRRRLTVLVVMAVIVALSGCAGMGQESMVNDNAPAGGQTQQQLQQDNNPNVIGSGGDDSSAPPPAPSDLLIDEVYVNTQAPSMNHMNITWKDNSSDETRFEVQYQDNTDNTWHSVDVPADAGEWSQQGVTNDVRYTYRVRACDSSVCSDWAKNATRAQDQYVAATARPQWDDLSNFTKLDYGVYWFKCGTCRTTKSDGSQGAQTSDGIKADPTDVGTAYYDSDKPTFIHIHGIQPNGRKERGSFVSPTDKTSDTASGWNQRGYNTGIFYWNQIADDNGAIFGTPLPPLIAEAKVWGQWSGQNYMRWRTIGGGFSTEGLPSNTTVASLFSASYTEALTNQNNPYIRLAAHSLGNQVAIKGTDLLAGTAPASLRPKRVALLDPYYSRTNAHLTIRPRDEATKLVGQLKSVGTLFEYYKTSNNLLIDTVDTIANQMAYVRIVPSYAGNPTEAHSVAVHWYLTSASYRPPAFTYDSSRRNPTPAGFAPSAAMPDTDLQTIDSCTQGCYWWYQRNGRNTPIVTDDDFTTETGSFK